MNNRVHLKKIIAVFLCLQLVLIPAMCITPHFFPFYCIFLLYYFFCAFFDKRPLIMYLCTLLSQTAFKIVSYDDHYLLHQNVYGNEVLDDIWRSITSAIYCDCFEKNSFSKKYKWLIKHYQKRYIANEFDVKFIVNSIAKYLKLDGYIKVNAVVESAAKNNLAGWFIPIAAKGCEI